jgi:DNA-binding winged helix-turn-helix (wHTH) protein/tetratricopeptide (TPR) repeat protein
MKTEGIFKFGAFHLDASTRTLRRGDTLITLNRRAFDVLLYCVQNPGKVLSRDELLKNVWPDAFVDENSLAQSISALRRALEEKPGDNSYIVTLPGRGYQFVSSVQVVAPENLMVAPEVAPGNAANRVLVLQQRTVRTSVITEEEGESGSATSRRFWAMAGSGVLLLVTLAVVAYVMHIRTVHRLTEKDTVVLADFANSTGDPVFDDTLKTALSVALGQSPFLNALSDSRVGGALQRMTRPVGTRLTPDVAREVCQRTDSQAYITGSIAKLGSQYVLALKAVNCQNGDTLGEEQIAAAAKEKVLDALGQAALKLRGELGESLTTVQKFDVPLAQATTPSLEALKAYSLAGNGLGKKDPAAALPYYQRAIELDPNFAMAYMQMGVVYFTLNEPGRADEYYTKAFQLRERTSEWEKLAINAAYFGHATGELDKAEQTLREEIEIYPRAIHGYVGLSLVYAQQGLYDKASQAIRPLLLLDPDYRYAYLNLANYSLAMQRFDEARQIIDQAHSRSLDDYLMHNALYALAFLGMDSAGMAEEQRWFAGQLAYENYGLALAADTEAFAGHVRKARELTKRAVDSALHADNKESGAVYQANAALQQAVYGNTGEAEDSAAEALKLAPASPGVAAEAALAFAMMGESARADSLAQDLGRRFPLNSQMQSLWLPAIHGQLALSRRNPSLSLNTLHDSSPAEMGTIAFLNNLSCLYTTYVRGEAYLAAGQGTAAGTEFQRILDHNGIVWNCWTGALAHLGLARANALQSITSQGVEAHAARVRALAAYQDFLTLWKDADPDIPILKQAKAEYAKLQ